MTGYSRVPEPPARMMPLRVVIYISDEETYSVGVYSNPEFDTDIIRYSYNSMTTPSSVVDYNMKDKSKDVKKEQEVLGGKFNKENYKS